MTNDPFLHRSRLEDGHIISTTNAELWIHDTGGPGEVVFLIGGFTAGHFVFDLVRPFMQDYRLITWEPRGLGLSRASLASDTELNAEVWAVYSAIVENFGTEGFAARVLANVFDVSGLPWFGDWEARNIEQVLRPETVNDTIGYCCTRADVRSHLPNIEAPVLIVQGGLSWDGEALTETSDPSLSRLQESISGLEVVTIAGAHPAYVLVQQPEACAVAVREFYEIRPNN